MEQILLYLVTLVVYFFVYNILVWGLNFQFGYSGILNFTYITFFALGAYASGVMTLDPPSGASHHVLGLSAPFLIALATAALFAGAVGLLVGTVALRRLRSDYLAIVMVSVGTIVFDLIANNANLAGGQDGLLGVPSPFNSLLNLDPNTYMYFFLAFSGLVMVLLGFFIMRLSDSPYGRSLRAIRDDPEVAEAFGKNTVNLRLIAMVIGCAYAGIGGALTIAFVGGLNPSGWQPVETFVIFTAMLVGGRANHWGSVLGAFLVPVLFVEATRFLPKTPANPELNAALRGIAIGLLIIGTLWFRPQGILPERKWPWRRRLGVADVESAQPVVAEREVAKVG